MFCIGFLSVTKIYTIFIRVNDIVILKNFFRYDRIHTDYCLS